MTPPDRDGSGPRRHDRCLRVGHKIIAPGSRLDDLAATLKGADWDMVELDVLARGDRLLVAHDPTDLELPEQIDFSQALRTLSELLPAHVGVDVDIKSTGYEAQVVDAVRAAGLTERTLISTMELDSLRLLRRIAPELRLGLSVPKARRNYLAHPVTRPAAYAMLAYLRRTLPGLVDDVLRTGDVDAIMAHWGVITPRLCATVERLGKELYVWTVDDHRRLPVLDRLGVTGVITNDRHLFSRAGLEPAG